LAAASYDGRVHVWDLNTGEMEHTLRYSWCVTDVAYSSNGKYLATGCFDQRVRVYEAQSMEHLATFDGHCARVDRVSFSPDSRYLAIAGLRNNLQVWDVEARTWQFPPPHQSEAAAAVVSGDEEFLISGGADERIRFWDLATAKELRTLIDDDYFKGGQSPIRALAHERGASLLVSGHANGLAKVWELPEGALRHKLVCSSKAGVLALALDRRGEILATADADGVVKLWNPQTGVHLHTLGGHAAPVHGLALSEDGRTLASGSADGMIRLWDADTGDELRTLSNNRLPVRGLAFVAGDQWLAIASDAALKLCDAVSGEERHIFRSHRGIVDMAYHPTRWMLAACGWEDRTIQLYDLRQNPPQQRLLSPYPSGLRVESLAFTPEGRYLITGNSDGTLFALQLAPPPKDSAE
jgi:WD40 repeat protein